MKIFSSKQIHIASTIAGPLAASCLISHNYLISGQKRASSITKIIGFIITLLLYIIVIIIVEKLLIPSIKYQNNRILSYSAVILLLLVLQSIFAFLLSSIVLKYLKNQVRLII
jgi:hypothetical protein